MPRRHRSTSARANRSRTTHRYSTLWKGLTDNAIAPAVRTHLNTNRAVYGTGRHSQRQKHSRGGGGKSSVAFVHDWMQPMSAIVEARKKNGLKRRSLRRQQQTRANRDSLRKRGVSQKGGFVRGGSVPYFPVVGKEGGGVCN